MLACSNQPPGTNAAKARYMSKDLPRTAKYFHVPLRFPKDTKVIMGTMPAQRYVSSLLYWDCTVQ
eukprot:7982-Heterococcus_DN1.PRE.4